MDAFFGFLSNPVVITLATILVGFLVKYVPAFAKVSNDIIPFLNAVLVFLTRVLAPQDANAASGIVGAVQSSPLLYAMVQSMFSAFVYDKFLRAPLGWLGIKKAV